MKRVLLVLLITLCVSVAGYSIFYHLATRPAKCMLDQSNGGMVWLRQEYHLSDAQYSKIAKMHDDYRPTCDRMCQQVAVANKKVSDLIRSSSTVTPEIEAALKDWARLQNECRLEMLQHVYAVSTEMNPEDGRRYVKMATDRIATPGMQHASLLAK